jgi:hypothetical protein
MATRFRTIFSTVLIACTAVATAAITATERLIAFALTLFRPEPLIWRQADELVQLQPAFAFADPHVFRHEAGMHARAAARGR